VAEDFTDGMISFLSDDQRCLSTEEHSKHSQQPAKIDNCRHMYGTVQQRDAALQPLRLYAVSPALELTRIVFLAVVCRRRL